MKKLFFFLTAMLVAITVNAQTDFSTPYSCAADDATLSGNIGLYNTSEPHYLRYNDNEVNGTAEWEIVVTKAAIVSVQLNMTDNVAGPKNGGHIFEVKIVDADEQTIDSISEPSESEVYTDIDLAGQLIFPKAGTYTVKLLNNRAWSKCGIAGITLTGKTLAETDFAGGYAFTADAAVLSGADGEIPP